MAAARAPSRRQGASRPYPAHRGLDRQEDDRLGRRHWGHRLEVETTGGQNDPTPIPEPRRPLQCSPSVRAGHTAVRAASAKVEWGGYAPQVGTELKTGSRYNPTSNSWTATSTLNAPKGQGTQTGVWTGSRMIVWGVTTDSYLRVTGGVYDPVGDTWRRRPPFCPEEQAPAGMDRLEDDRLGRPARDHLRTKRAPGQHWRSDDPHATPGAPLPWPAPRRHGSTRRCGRARR